MANWDRQYRLTCEADGSSFEIGEPDAVTGRAIHINFSIEKSDSTTLNSTKIKVWNLTKSQIGILSTTGCMVTLCAGYGNSRPVVFYGVVSNVAESLDSSDRLVTIEAVDGFLSVSETVVSVSYSRKTTCYTIFCDVAERIGIAVVCSSYAKRILQTKIFTNGYSYIGYAQYVFDDIANKTSLVWSIQDGVLQMRKSTESISTTLHVISKDTGLVNIPERVYSSQVAATDTSSDTVADTLYGYKIQYFMDGSIGIGDRIYLKSNIATGTFMVSSLTIDGDNIEGEWKCTAEVTETTV